jgi:geranylgeranyl diphosphate synthase, type I
MHMIACEEQSPTWLESRLRATEILMQASVLPTGAVPLDDLITYHLGSGGSRTRAKLALSSAHALELPDRTCLALAACCELIHNASLLHDDIQDQDSSRRGREAAWHRFNVNTAMCAGTLLLSGAYRALADVPSGCAELVAHTHQRTTELIAGQVLDLALPDDHSDLAHYLRITTGKSGSLLALPLELSLIAARQPESLALATNAGHAVARAYQIMDDITDCDDDLRQGHNNVVSVLMRSGAEQAAAIAMATQLARKHLDQAMAHAQWLPAGSGQGLAQLCEQLQHSLSTEIPLRAQTA